MSDSVRPRRRQPARLSHPWDSLGKNTWVGCHFLLQCMKVKGESEVAQSCLTLSDPMDCMDCSLPGSSVHGIFQARVLERGAIAFSDSTEQILSNLRYHQLELTLTFYESIEKKEKKTPLLMKLILPPTFYFEIISDLQKNHRKKSTETSYILLIRLPLECHRATEP